MLYPARSILVIDSSPFGQSLALLPVMRALRASYPNTLLVAAAANGTCELLMADGSVDETIPLGVIKDSEHGRPGGLKRLLGLGGRARRYTFDVVLDFSPSLETTFVSRLMLRARVVTPSRLRRFVSVLAGLRGPSQTFGTAASAYENVLEQLGVDMDDLSFSITPSVEADARFEQRLTRSGSRGGELIVLLYTANPKSRRSWPVSAFGEIGTRLANNFDARVVAADEPSDNSFTKDVSSLLRAGSIKLAEPGALELVAGIARSSVIITDEPAVSQIATELGTPVIEVADAFSSSSASSPGHRIAQRSSRSQVSPDSVYEIACEMIQENRSPSLFQRP